MDQLFITHRIKRGPPRHLQFIEKEIAKEAIKIFESSNRTRSPKIIFVMKSVEFVIFE